ncbi:MAG: type II toxin-antitoxin system VapC family toxin [Planctomycetota bacterium]
MKLFVDTSAFLKRYVDEAGSERIDALCAEAEALGLSVLVYPESIAAFCRLRREGRLSAPAYRRLRRDLEADLAAAALLPLEADALGSAVDALEAAPLRAADAIHIGAALSWGAERFVSADRRQLDAAEAVGLSVEIIA